jgi:hypothetical protein
LCGAILLPSSGIQAWISLRVSSLPLCQRTIFIACGAETSPEAYRLLNSFRASSSNDHSRFKGERAKIILKGLQITAGLTLGLLAWDKKDRAAAAKRYKEALDVAATHTAFGSVNGSPKHFERWVAIEVNQIRENLHVLVENDISNAQSLKENNIQGGSLRRDTVEIRNLRIEGDGTPNPQATMIVATDECRTCNKRNVKLQRCSRCKKVACTSWFLPFACISSIG